MIMKVFKKSATFFLAVITILTLSHATIFAQVTAELTEHTTNIVDGYFADEVVRLNDVDKYLSDNHSKMVSAALCDFDNRTGFKTLLEINSDDKISSGAEYAQKIFEEKYGDTNGISFYVNISTNKMYIQRMGTAKTLFDDDFMSTLLRDIPTTLSFDNMPEYISYYINGMFARYFNTAQDTVATEKVSDNTDSSETSEPVQRLFNLDNTFTKSQCSSIEENLASVAKKTGFNVAIVVTDNINSKSAMEFADDYYDNLYGIDTDGILLLLNNDTKKDWISTSGICIRYFTDSRINSIFDRITPKLQDSNFDGAADSFADLVLSYYYDGIPDKQYNYDTETGEKDYYDEDTSFSLVKATFIGIGIGIATFFIFICIIKGRYKNKKSCPTSAYLVPGQTSYSKKEDTFVREFTTQHTIESSSGGSGHSGGSSTHHSSSGGSHGGGGRSR